VRVVAFEATAFETHSAVWRACLDACGGAIDGVLVCHGWLVDQPQAQADPDIARRLIDVNFTSAVSILERAAAHLAERGRGWIAAVSSVAGDRGRRSNYLYGAPKAGLSTYLEGLRYRLGPAGVSVLTVKPGFIDTAMTWGKVNPRLAASPQRVARDIHRGIRRRRAVIYTPWPWRWVMLIIRAIPAFIFRRLTI
jgi:short-subunit dehydrogenase